MATCRLTSGERRLAIIETATRLFSEKGFRGVTTRELALAVGVSEPVLYQHFQTKRELYEAIVESKSGQVQQKFEPTILAMQDFSRTDDRAILRQIAMNINRWWEEDATLHRLLLFSSLEGHEFSELFFARHASCHFDIMKQYFEHRMEKGVFRRCDPVTACWSFFGMVAHHAMTKNLYHFDPYPAPKEQVIDQMIDLFLRGIEKQQ
jgi:AcrR family transcriptional regulator